MKYEYTPVGVNFKAHGKLCWMPFVETTICGPSGCRTGFALVDSGAVDCLINIEYAGALGITLDRNNARPTYGVAGKDIAKPTYLAEVDMQVKYLERVKVSAAFIESDAVDIILGQDGFFDRFKIRFEKDHNVFEINPSKK